MVKRTIEAIVDDIDGSPNARPIWFSLDGKRYVRDLGSANSRRLFAILRPYRKAGRLLNPKSKPESKELSPKQLEIQKRKSSKERILAASEIIKEQRESRKRASEIVRSYRGKTNKKKSG